MDIRDIREIMGLTQAQVADELGVPKQEVIDCEENGETYLLLQYISAFPINPQILKDPDVDPFLPSFDQTSPGERMRLWREEHGLAPEDVASALGITPMELLQFEGGVGSQLARRRGEEIERRVGINRKWLMYGDGRVKGTPRVLSAPEAPRRGERAPKEAHTPAPNREAGQRVKQARVAAGLSREALADLLKLSVSRVAQMESGYIKDKKAEHILSRIASVSDGDPAPETPKEAGLRLREARKAAGLSVKEAAEIMSLKHTTLAHLESGYITPKRADELIARMKELSSQGAAPFNPKEAGVRIREERVKAGLSQKELGTILRLPITRITHIELGDVTEAEADRILRRIHGKPLRDIRTRRVKQTDQVILGSNIRDARETAGLSQKALGELLHLPQTKISLIERGKVDEATAKKILQMLNTLIENQEAGISSPEPAAPADEAAPAAGSRPRKAQRPDLGKKVKEARLAAGMSQKAVADLLEISQGGVSYMESGRLDEETAEKVLRVIAEAGEKKEPEKTE